MLAPYSGSAPILFSIARSLPNVLASACAPPAVSCAANADALPALPSVRQPTSLIPERLNCAPFCPTSAMAEQRSTSLTACRPHARFISNSLFPGSSNRSAYRERLPGKTPAAAPEFVSLTCPSLLANSLRPGWSRIVTTLQPNFPACRRKAPPPRRTRPSPVFP